jgi:hypothetical protein
LVGVIHVEQHPSRPVVATKNDKGINEGDIYFRYSGVSTRIKYSDLRSLLDARDTQTRANILPLVERLLELGPSRAMILDLEDGQLIDGDHTIQIDESLIDRVSFIKEGEFDEKSGEPTLRLVGDVRSVSGPTVVKKGIVSRANMLDAFLDNKLEAEPVDYLRYAVENSVGEWLPIRRFANAAGFSRDDLVKFIDGSSASESRKKTYTKRVSSDDAAYVEPTKPAAEALGRILKGETIQLSNADEAYRTAYAIQGLKHPLSQDPDDLRILLKECHEMAKRQPKHPIASTTRKAVARLDELLFPLSG